MNLADTSVWIHFFRFGDSQFEEMLVSGSVAMHDLVLGELACGNLSNRTRTMADLRQLPRIASATSDEVLFLIEEARLYGRGLGWVDMHLLAASRLSQVGLFTLDEALKTAATDLGVAARRKTARELISNLTKT